jgi:hypothetical protein
LDRPIIIITNIIIIIIIVIQEFIYSDTTNVEHEMYDYTGCNLSHWNSNKRFKDKFGSHTRKNSIDSLQNTAILGTSHIIGEVLQSEPGNLSGGDHCWLKRSTKKERHVTEEKKRIITTIPHLEPYSSAWV